MRAITKFVWIRPFIYIKTVVKKRSSLLEFLNKICLWIQSHNHENDFQAAKDLLKRPVIMSDMSDDEKEYISFLMPEPFAQVKLEMKCKVANKTQQWKSRMFTKGREA